MMHWLSTLSRHDFVGDRNEAVKEAAKRKQDCEQKTEESTEKKGPESKESVTCTMDVGDRVLSNCSSEQ